jgi:phage baseplate assembly protein W
MAAANAKRAFQGRGWLFPIRASGGQVATNAFEEQIAQSIRLIIGTNPGERRMRPEFGAGLNAFVFEPVSAATLEGIRRRVRDALIDWEPRIEVERVTAAVAGEGRVDIEVFYKVRATNTHRNLVYPFYLEEGTKS